MGRDKSIIASDAAVLHQFKSASDCDTAVLMNEPQLQVKLEQLPAGAMELLRFYASVQQYFHLLAGEATVEMDSARVQLRKGEGLLMEPGAVYRILNSGTETLRYVVTSQPGSAKDMLPL